MLTLTVDCGAPACKGGGIEFKRVPAAQWRSDAEYALFDDDDRKAWYEDNDSDDEPPDWYEDEMFKKYQEFCDERGYVIYEVRSFEDDDYEALKEAWSKELLERQARWAKEEEAAVECGRTWGLVLLVHHRGAPGAAGDERLPRRGSVQCSRPATQGTIQGTAAGRGGAAVAGAKWGHP